MWRKWLLNMEIWNNEAPWVYGMFATLSGTAITLDWRHVFIIEMLSKFRVQVSSFYFSWKTLHFIASQITFFHLIFAFLCFRLRQEFDRSPTYGIAWHSVFTPTNTLCCLCYRWWHGWPLLHMLVADTFLLTFLVDFRGLYVGANPERLI